MEAVSSVMSFLLEKSFQLEKSSDKTMIYLNPVHRSAAEVCRVGMMAAGRYPEETDLGG